jgi:hypothetical protein
MAEIPQPSVQERVVAFVDVLGFTRLVRQAFSGDNELLKQLHRILRVTAIHAVVTSGDILPEIKSFLSPNLRATAFSDSIVISDVWQNGGLERVMSTASLLASLLLQEGILSRGGIAKGKTIHDERILLGNGYLAAYELEHKVAVFPRLVIADDLVPEAEQLTGCHIKTDFDGFRFIDVFYQYSGMHQAVVDILIGKPQRLAVPTVNAFGRVREVVVLGLAKEKKPSILAKYRWLARQFNEAVMAYVPGQVEPVTYS